MYLSGMSYHTHRQLHMPSQHSLVGSSVGDTLLVTAIWGGARMQSVFARDMYLCDDIVFIVLHCFFVYGLYGEVSHKHQEV